MGRRKLEIKRIENKSSQQVTFCKRRNGLMEKARQLSILCESSVAVLAVSASGKLYNSCSGDNMSKIIDRYEIQLADERKALDLEENTRTYLPHNELLETVQSKLEEPNVDNVSVDSLISLEEQLEAALSVTRARKSELMMEFVKTLNEKEILLKEENQVLANQVLANQVLADQVLANQALANQIGKKFLVTEDESALSPDNSSGNKTPETLPLFK